MNKPYEEVVRELDEALAQKQRWFNEHQKVLDVKNELLADLKKVNEALNEAVRDMQHIVRTAKPYDTGEREYSATDWDYVLVLATRWLDKWRVR